MAKQQRNIAVIGAGIAGLACARTLAQAGHRVLATSGSSGKCSFLNHTVGDHDLKKRHFKYSVGWPYVRSNADRTVFCRPSQGTTRKPPARAPAIAPIVLAV